MNTPSILLEIAEKKKQRIKEEKQELSLLDMISLANKADTQPSFYEAIKKEGLSIIGEIKKASPSKGTIRSDFDPISIAMEYKNCVDAISVLTEADYFKGNYDYLKNVSKKVNLPLLLKDFIFDEYQIYKAKAIGASAVLLIVSLLSKNKLKELLDIAHFLKLDILVETHDIYEAKRAKEAGAKIIGINNRNLHTFEVNLEATIKVSKVVDKKTLLVSESGIKTNEDIKYLKKANIDALLIGESFMRCENIEQKVLEFKNAYCKS